ncbi:MAG: glycosyltransferase family 4 protein [Phycisphaeraceae bacterium]
MVAACPFPFERGTPVRIHRMSEALVARGHTVELVTYHLGDHEVSLPFDVHRIREVKTYTKTDAGPSYQKLAVCDPLLAKLLRRVIRDKQIEVVHAHHFEGLLTALWATRGTDVPVVFDCHTLLTSELQYYGMGLIKRMKVSVGRWFDANLPRRADYVTAVTEDIAQQCVDRCGVHPDRVAAVVNGVELDTFTVPEEEVYRPSHGKPTVVFTGNFAAYQGVEHLFEVFAKLKAMGSETRLMLVTPSPLGELEAVAKRLGVLDRIDLESVGFSGVPSRLAGALIAANPRIDCDGIPQKLLNYMAAGKPTVSFEGSAKILRDGVTGLRVPNGDIEGFATAIQSLVDDPERAQRMGQAARDEVRLERTWRAAAERIEHAYDVVLGQAVPAHHLPTEAAR